MPEAVKNVTYDVDGSDIITDMLLALLNEFPGLIEGEKIRFSTLEEESGITFYPISGAVVYRETKSVTGKVNQLCNYPFTILYRTAADSPTVKADIKEFLDNLGKWLERQAITIGGEEYTLESYPTLTGGRKIEEMTRQTPGYLNAVYENGVQDWTINVTLRYRNIFYRNS